MKNNWQRLSILLASEAVAAQRVFQASVQHFESENAGPWQPLLTLGFGTPAQVITGIFDTGSSDAVIPQAGSALCQVKNQQCAPPAPIVRGDFDPAKSSDVGKVDRDPQFNASFSGGDSFNGKYIKTTVTLDAAGKVPEAQVGLASGGQPSGNFPQFAIFGVGPKDAEFADDIYPNLPEQMKAAGITKGVSYSVVLNATRKYRMPLYPEFITLTSSLTALSNGSVFFGGIDRSKFTGELQQVAIDRDNQGKISDFVLKMTSMKLQMNGPQPRKSSKQDKRDFARMKRAEWRIAAQTRNRSKAKGTYSNKETGGDDAVSIQSSGSNKDDGLKEDCDEEGRPKSGGGKNGDGDECRGKGKGGGKENGGMDEGKAGNGDGDGGEAGSGKGNGTSNNGEMDDGRGKSKGDGQGMGKPNSNKNGEGKGGKGEGEGDGECNTDQDKGTPNAGGGKKGGENNGCSKGGKEKNNGNNGKDGNGNKGGEGRNGKNQGGDMGGAARNQTSGNAVDLGLKGDDVFSLFDTGGVDFTLPANVVSKMAKMLGTTFSARDGMGPVDCKVLSADNKILMNFNNGKTTAEVPLSFLRVSKELTDPEITKKGMCEVGVEVRAKDDVTSIGFPFFAAVYTVFDLENNSLWFAPAKGDPSAPAGKLEEFP